MSGARPKGFIRPKKEEEVLVGDPLDTKIMIINSHGVEKRVPALHKGWVEKRTLSRYIPPPYEEDGVYAAGAQEMWLELMEYLEEDLKHLLTLPHHRFWSQVVYDPGVHQCLESYLINARRGFDDGQLDDFSVPVIESIHRLVLLVCIRMATYKESKENHITPLEFGNIIYDYFLFDICKLFDLCILYGHSNPELITKMIGNIFTNQNKYYADLCETIPTINLALGNIEEKLGVAENYLPAVLSSTCGQLAVDDVHDITLFFCDTLMSLEMFLTCHLPACKCLAEVNFDVRLSACYERVVPTLMDILCDQCSPETELWINKIIKRINTARSSIVKICRLIIEYKCFGPLRIEKPIPSLVSECIEKFLQVMSTCVEEKIFITDYCSIYPLCDDLEFFKKHEGDVTNLNFITDAVSTAMTELGSTSTMTNLSLDMKNLNLAEPTAKDTSPSDTSGMNGYMETKSAIPTDIELSSMVSHVQDLLPELGAGFIQQCLQHYGYSTESVINALLENSLPPSLITLDKSAPAPEKPTPPPQAVPVDTEEKTVEQVDCMDRANVYDNDEFDVFARKDVDQSKIHKGKKVNTILKENADEEDKQRLKDIVRQYEETGGTSIYEDEFRYEPDVHRGWMYEDEYDDTYDGGDAGNLDIKTEFVKKIPGIIGAGRLNTHIDLGSNSESEEQSDTEEKSDEVKKDQNTKSFSNQSGTKPKNLGSKRGVQRIYKPSSKPQKPDEKTPTPEREVLEDKPRDQFCVNPAEVRQRQEQQRQERDAYYNRGYRGRDQQPGQENGANNDHYVPRPKVSAASNRNSGKSWRQGQSGGADDENRRYHGGKYKEDTNHGKAQSQDYRHKMTHKNEHKRQGAQAKFNRNN